GKAGPGHTLIVLAAVRRSAPHAGCGLSAAVPYAKGAPHKALRSNLRQVSRSGPCASGKKPTNNTKESRWKGDPKAAPRVNRWTLRFRKKNSVSIRGPNLRRVSRSGPCASGKKTTDEHQ